jgi:hypothetical protein
LGSFVLTGAAIRCQDKATQEMIRTAFERRAGVYRTSSGLDLPVAFKVGSGTKPTSGNPRTEMDRPADRFSDCRSTDLPHYSPHLWGRADSRNLTL